MQFRQLALVAGLLAGGWIMAQVAAPLRAQRPDAPTTTTSEKQDDGDKSLRVRYAEAYQKLMEAELAKYEATNRQLPGTIRPSVMEALSMGVRKAADRVQAAKNGETNMGGSAILLAAQTDLGIAEASLRKAQQANLQQPNAVRAVEVTRLQAALDLARLRVDLAKQVESESPLSQLEWEVGQLREQVLELRLIVALLRDRN